ncbi:uncharacterized protein MONBRDRAFT_29084 [Monosiga brevicollis MX1]|uniref:WD repeat protein mio zinc-ribbon like domain-containing protein n=1 Tax=Monosiga brevicollis TaxID=81824 RepID=A9VA28_MONBE|nr:uncharacterized protein MONBRDRAFT_29084 [Monosiga brevicollis MX1]EDQ85593.1 predicted protein [Monosiga brevicollis MX1]|eukprot:XP_001749542.1 hypothetical protein [Monosiga brevicollis MX1]
MASAAAIRPHPLDPNLVITLGKGIRAYNGALEPLEDCALTDEVYLHKIVAEWQPRSGSHLLAIGCHNGTVHLQDVDPANDSDKRAAKILVPRLARVVTDVQWQPKNTNLLAVGFQKDPKGQSREGTLYIYDVSTAMVNLYDRRRHPDSMTRHASSRSNALHRVPGLIEINVGEGVSSLAWRNLETAQLVVGHAAGISLYDLRSSSEGQRVTRKACNRVRINPNNPDQLISISGQEVQLFDLRKTVKPVHSPHCSNPISLDWCSTFLQKSQVPHAPVTSRPGLMGVLSKDSDCVHITDYHWRLERSAAGGEDVEMSTMTQSSSAPEPVAAFAWNPHVPAEMLSITASGQLCRLRAPYHNVVALSCQGMVMSRGAPGQLLSSVDRKAAQASDISMLMRDRLDAGYGLDVNKNLEITADQDDRLCDLWRWLQGYQDAASSFFGVVQALHLPSEHLQNLQPTSARVDYNQAIVVATHDATPQRNLALQICNWRTDAEEIEIKLRRLETRQEFERAAATALFCQNIERAMACLTSHRQQQGLESDPILVSYAMTLAGYQPDATSNRFWRQTCAQLKAQLTNPYLRAGLAFLTSDGTDYSEVLRERGMRLTDRLAFACRYLNDEALEQSIKDITAEVTASGQLDGLLLTGASENGLTILQSYLDRTGDVQSVFLIAACMLQLVQRQRTTGTVAARNLHSDQRFVGWYDSYRRLLDQWRRWMDRARLEVKLHALLSNRTVKGQVTLKCSSCSKRLNTLDPRYRTSALSQRTAAHGCPSCRKPLPRCAVCAQRLGNPAHIHRVAKDKGAPEPTSARDTLDGFDVWFSWCQTCRHGAHAKCLQDWFEHHETCPVAGCECTCASY